MQFDMKQALFYFVDGYTNSGTVSAKSGAINNSGGYTAGASTMLVNGITGAVATGQVFKVAGDVTVYTISSHTETLGNTTSITFTPVLATSPADSVVITFGIAAGATSIPVTGFTGEVPNGVLFNIPEDTNTYIVTQVTNTLGATTALGLSSSIGPTGVAVPGAGLADNVFTGDIITIAGRTMRMKVGDGTMSYDEKRTVEYKKDRGLLDTVRLGDQDPMEVKFDLRWEFLLADSTDPATSSYPSPEDVMKQRGGASNWVSTSPDPCEPYCIDIYVVYMPLCPAVKYETYLLHMFRYETLNHEFKQGMIAATGKCNVQTAVVSRLPQPSA